jgi:tetratricopeptide (TPR) repeat protein
MPKDYDRFFAQTAVHNKALTPEMAEACMEKLRQLEIEGEAGTFARVAVEEGALPREKAEKIIQLINGKFPGKHPPIDAPAPKKAPAAAPPPAPTPAPAPRPSPRAAAPRQRPAPAPAKKQGRAVLCSVLGGVAMLVAAVVIALAVKGKSKAPPPEEPKREAVRKHIPPPPDPVPPKPVPKPEPVPEPKPEPKPEPQPQTPPAAPDAEAEFRARLEEKRKKARARVEEIRREMAEEKRASDEADRALRDRLSKKSFAAALRSGATHSGATIRSFTFTDVELEAGGKTVALPWDALAPASILAAADAIYDFSSADRQFERGRFLVARRLWKEALESFQRAVKIDENLQSKVDEVKDLLERLVSGQGSFKGAARRLGADGLSLAYDWKSDAQAGDFSHGLKIEKGAAVLQSEKKSGVAIQEVEFLDEVDLDLKITATGKVTVFLFAREGAYEIEMGPDASALFRAEPQAAEKRKELARDAKAAIPKGKPVAVRVTARDRGFKLFLDRKEVLAYADPPAQAEQPPLKGRVGFSVEGGKLEIAAPLAVQGRVDPRELEKHFGEIEVLTRRANDPELQDIEQRRIQELAEEILGKKGLTLTADDRYFIFRIQPKDLAAYDRVKQAVAQNLPPFQEEEEIKAPLDRLIAAFPDVPSLYYLRGLYHWERQDAAPLRADVEKALQLFPDFTEALVLHARYLEWQGDRDAALKASQRAIETMPDYAPAYGVRAMQVFRRERGAAGEPWADDLRLAVKIQPSNREAQSNLRVLKYAARGPRDLGCRFEVQTDHYHVVTDISQQAADLYAERLEAAWRHFAETFKDVPLDRTVPRPRVAIFNTTENYYTYFELLSEQRGEHTLGVFRPGLNELVLFEHMDLDATLHTLYHEQFHQFTTLMVKHPLPYWFNEGIAEYMGAITIKDGKVVERGRMLKDRLKGLQMSLAMGFSLPFEKIMMETPREFYSGPVGFKYAQAWSMVHFFFEHEKGKYRDLILKYFHGLRSGRTSRQAYEEVFKAGAADLQKEWTEYVKKLRA